MTEEQIERAVERKFNSLDAMLMNGRLSQEEYEEEAKEIARWADEAYFASRCEYLDR